MNVYLKLNTLLVTYNHDAIHQWIQTNFLRNKNVKNKQILNCDNSLVTSDKRIVENKNIIEKLARKLIVNACAEFCQISALFNLSGNTSYIGFNHLKMILEQVSEHRGGYNIVNKVL